MCPVISIIRYKSRHVFTDNYFPASEPCVSAKAMNASHHKPEGVNQNAELFSVTHHSCRESQISPSPKLAPRGLWFYFVCSVTGIQPNQRKVSLHFGEALFAFRLVGYCLMQENTTYRHVLHLEHKNLCANVYFIS